MSDGAKVVVADPLGAAGLDLLRATGARVVDVSAQPERLTDELADAQALLVRSRTKVGGELLLRARELQVIGRAGVGVDNIDLAAAARAGVLVVNAPTSNLISAVEHTFALLLAPAICRRPIGRWPPVPGIANASPASSSPARPSAWWATARSAAAWRPGPVRSTWRWWPTIPI
jgi:hypothetical protein